MKRLISLLLLMTVVFVSCKKDEPIVAEYTVTFNSQGGSSVAALKVKEGEKLTKPTDPTKEKYNFAGWFKDSECTNAWNFGSDVVTQNMTLYAKWIDVDKKTYTVTFETYGGTEIDPAIVIEGDTVIRPINPIKEKYNFAGWFKESDYVEPWDFSNDVVTQNTTLYAKWIDKETYTVEFETYGGTEIDPAIVIEGDTVPRPTDPTKEKYNFAGWFKESECTNPWDFSNDVVTQNMTLYAKWSDKSTYTIAFETDGGSAITPAIVIENDTVPRPKDPTKPDYSFENWYTNSDLNTLYDFTTPVTQDMTLYAKWKVSVFKLVDFEPGPDFEANGIVWDEATRTLDITKAKAGSVLKFNAIGASSVTSNIEHEYDTYASSIGGENELKKILVAGSLVDGKIPLRVNVPVQSIKVPLDIQATVLNFDDEKESAVITITSRPDYAGTRIQPILMANHTTGKQFYWAPVNAGATEIPTSVPQYGDITSTCGLLFQWGRKSGVAATTDVNITSRDTTGVGALGFPVQSSLANMSKWDGKFICYRTSNPNSQYNWLLINGTGKDNPTANEMKVGAWYQKLWNSGTEDNALKANADPCPAGWRVPTREEWKAIGAGNMKWDRTNGLFSVAGVENGQKLILPAAGYRRSINGASYMQSAVGYYWSSSVPAGSVKASYVHFNSDMLITGDFDRTFGYPVRCVQE